MGFTISNAGKIAWVTGSSRGIGRAIALALAESGCDVAVTYNRNESEARQVCESVDRLGRRTISVRCDVSDAKSCTEAFEQVVQGLGAPDILVNSAGVTADQLFLMLSEEDWSRVLNTNLMGAVYTSRLVLKDMMAKRFGRIINLSSVAAAKSGRGQANYAASKAALEAMSRSLSCEVARRGITINCIAPGVIETEMSQEIRKLATDQILERQLIKRFGNVEEVAAWAVMLASEHGAFMTGEVISLTGGLKMA